jgi:hypothetical protein
MSELIVFDRRAMSRKQLLATASAFVLTSYVVSTDAAQAADSDRPTVWIELGGQMEYLQGTSRPFVAPFMSVPPRVTGDIILPPDSYSTDIFPENQQVSRSALGLQGRVDFHPEGSDWVFSAGIRYGRSHTHKHGHEQGPNAYKYFNNFKFPIYAAEFADEEMRSAESHMLLDFSAGKDVGLGTFGRNGSSNVSAGVRFAQFSARSSVTASARPDVGHDRQYATFYQYKFSGEQQRSFHGIGPSLAWNASAALWGSREDAELSFDWGVNGAVLFGRQKAHTAHATNGVHMIHVPRQGPVRQHFTYVPLYTPRNYESARSRSVAVPDLGGFAGFSVRYPNAKVSLGYRADFFFGAMDTGIDARHAQTVGFHGPFATIGIGLGG